MREDEFDDLPVDAEDDGRGFGFPSMEISDGGRKTAVAREERRYREDRMRHEVEESDMQGLASQATAAENRYAQLLREHEELKARHAKLLAWARKAKPIVDRMGRR
jgi:hypothetical protein